MCEMETRARACAMVWTTWQTNGSKWACLIYGALVIAAIYCFCCTMIFFFTTSTLYFGMGMFFHPCFWVFEFCCYTQPNFMQFGSMLESLWWTVNSSTPLTASNQTPKMCHNNGNFIFSDIELKWRGWRRGKNYERRNKE